MDEREQTGVRVAIGVCLAFGAVALLLFILCFVLFLRAPSLSGHVVLGVLTVVAGLSFAVSMRSARKAIQYGHGKDRSPA